MDEYCRRPGRIPFKWEIQPGVPKSHHRSNIAAASPPPQPPSKLAPPPRMASPSPSLPPPSSLSKSRSQWHSAHSSPLNSKLSPPPYMAFSSSSYRSPATHTASPSPSRATTTVFHRSASASPSKRRGQSSKVRPALAPQVISVPPGCFFPVLSLKRNKDNKKSVRGNGGVVEAAVESPRYSASSRSSSSLSSPFRGSVLARDEVEAAARWFF